MVPSWRPYEEVDVPESAPILMPYLLVEAPVMPFIFKPAERVPVSVRVSTFIA